MGKARIMKVPGTVQTKIFVEEYQNGTLAPAVAQAQTASTLLCLHPLMLLVLR
jgi:hypothetical protein